MSIFLVAESAAQEFHLICTVGSKNSSFCNYSTNPQTIHIKEEGYNHADSGLFMNPNRIFGASAWSKSLDAIDYVPGGFAEAAIVITPRKSKTFVQSITLGCNASFYYKQLPLMQGQQAYPWEVCLFAGLAIGKRW